MSRKRTTEQPEAPAATQPGASGPASPQHFTEEEYNQLVDLLNVVAEKAEFNKMSVKDVLRFTKLLSSVQRSILPKIRSHQFEIIGVTQAKAGE